ncbi:uncharacterized protein C1orf127 homolog [Leptodactylus fuscus]
MELWIPRRQMDGLLLWLSRVMKFPVSLNSLDRSNHLIARCRYALDMDSNGNFIFRVHYSACSVQTQNGFHVLEIHMVKKTSSGNGRSDRYLMRCPAVTAAMGRERVRCDPNYVQVSRPMPLQNGDQDWFLLFRGELVVSVEDSSLIGVEVEMNKSGVRVRGLRNQLLTSREFLDGQMDMLPLWLGYGVYAYSLEASCPPVMQKPGEEVIVHIPKQRMGLVKRGSYIAETLTLKNIMVGHPLNVTVTENKHFVMVNIRAADILQAQACTTPDIKQGIQAFYSIDLVLEFAEIAYPMNWTMENYYECRVLSPATDQQETFSKSNKAVASSMNKEEEDYAIQSSGDYPLLSAPDPSRLTSIKSTVTSVKAKTDPVKLTGTFIEGSGEHMDSDISGSRDYQNITHDQINVTRSVDTVPDSSNNSITFPPKYPNIHNLVQTTLLHPQDKHSKISHGLFSNSTKSGEPKNVTLSVKVLSTLAPTSFSNETLGKNETTNVKTLDYEETRWTTVPSPITKAIKHGGSMSDSAVKQEDANKPLNSQQISGKTLKDDTDLWDLLIGDTITELLHETVREGLIAPDYRHKPSRKSKTGSLQRPKNKSVPDTEEQMMDATSIPGLSHPKRPARDLQPMAEDSTLSSRHMEWSILNNPHEDKLDNTSSEIETIGSTEQLIVTK